jgi:hypothetical protein
VPSDGVQHLHLSQHIRHAEVMHALQQEKSHRVQWMPCRVEEHTAQ